jgi:hypothetical protein
VYVYVCVYVCVHAHRNDTAFLLEAADGLELQVLDTVCVYMYVCMYVCMHVCMYMCVCIYVCICMHAHGDAFTQFVN